MKINIAFASFSLLATAIIYALYSLDTVAVDDLLYDVNNISEIDLFETKWLYAILHIFIAIPVLLLSFDKKVNYVSKWKFIFPGVFLTALLFLGWDIFFTKISVWTFNENYITGIKIFNLPFEEILFFFTVPFATVFIYECLKCYFKNNFISTNLRPLFLSFALLLIGLSSIYYNHIYTATTFLLTGLFICLHLLCVKSTYLGRFLIAYLLSLIPFLIFNGVLTGLLTQQPIVVYNQSEYFGTRIFTIPIDDSIYSFLLLFMNVSFYEYLSDKSTPAAQQKPSI